MKTFLCIAAGALALIVAIALVSSVVNAPASTPAPRVGGATPVPREWVEQAKREQAAAASTSTDDVGSQTALIWFHNNCQSIFYPPELSQLRLPIKLASPAEVRAGERLVENGKRVWGEAGYCSMLTEMIKKDLPNFATRLR